MAAGRMSSPDQPDRAVLENGLLQQLDQPAPEIARRAHIVDHHQIGPVLARIGQQHRLAHHRQQQHCVPHAPVPFGENRGREGREVIAQIGEIARPVVERAPDHQQRVISRGRCLFARDLLRGRGSPRPRSGRPLPARSLGNLVESLRCSHRSSPAAQYERREPLSHRPDRSAVRSARRAFVTVIWRLRSQRINGGATKSDGCWRLWWLPISSYP